jgi:hypothetical protein
MAFVPNATAKIVVRRAQQQRSQNTGRNGKWAINLPLRTEPPEDLKTSHGINGLTLTR